ncbi:MAG: S8 family serine peptidase, partial [Chlorobiales bacterium]|nr:S8 family serine peptidase [Chlorobiales bacterium]
MKQNRVPALFGATILTALLFGLIPSETLLGKPPVPRRPNDSWSFISKTTCAVDRFLNQHPTADGRGVIVVILDTGVDMGVAGLQKTSLGTQKVIDIQNFSGSGDVALTKPITSKSDSGLVFQDSTKRVKLTGFERLGLKAKPDSYRIGVFDEQRMRNSDISDLDGDGKSNTLFGILVCETESGFLAIVDTDANGSLSDERPIHSYKKQFDTFSFARRSKDKRPTMTCALNIFPNKNLVVLHFDDGSHGTHVAGIATGYNIFSENSEQTFDGIAPGAEVVSCKISDGSIGDLSTTGSIKAGFDYAAELSRSQSKPVVVNMSFGIPSVMEGLSDLEQYLDTLIESHANLYVCLSNGNEGPGISSTGLPAASKRAISVGALNNKDIARESFGSLQETNMIWNFSSRGGEVQKPDIVAPGSAHSTIPNFASRTLSSGTSMSSPYIAGSIAVLLSALRQEDSAGIARHLYPQRIIKTALRVSATPMLSYTELDCGTGILNVENAYRTLLSYRKSGFVSKLIDYNIQTDSPNLGADMDGPTAYWRTVNFLQDKSTQNFKVTPVFTRDFPAAEK